MIDDDDTKPLKARPAAVAELRKLYIANGHNIDGEIVVAAARNKRNPLHKYFVWDTAKAAHLYRIHIARRLIGSVTLVRQTSNGVAYVVPGYRHNPDAPKSKSGYRSLEDIAASAPSSARMMLEEITWLNGCLDRVMGFAMEVGFQREVRDIAKRVGSLRARIEAKGRRVVAASKKNTRRKRAA